MMERKSSYKCIVIDFQDHDIIDQGLKIVHKYMELLNKRLIKSVLRWISWTWNKRYNKEPETVIIKGAMSKSQNS